MSNIQVQFRRGTTSQHSSFAGAEGEVTVDTDLDTLMVHTGGGAGTGVRLAKHSELSSGSPSQTWTEFAVLSNPTRVLGTTYTNNTGNTISINAGIYCIASGGVSAPAFALQINTGTVQSPTWLSIDYFNLPMAFDKSASVSGLIPDGVQYRATLGASTGISLSRWVELR